MTFTLSRRRFGLGAGGLALATLLPRPALAQSSVRSVTTPLGTYDIPGDPQRVACIDSRLDLQPALALGLPVIGYSHSVPGDWVPVPKDAQFYGAPLDMEAVLASEPDLILCVDYDRASEWWPIDRLAAIAPVLPTPVDVPWKDAMAQLATWLDRQGAADAAIAEYDALIADIRARQAEKLAKRVIVSVAVDGDQVYLMNGSTMMQSQVFADLGAATIPPDADQLYDTGPFAPEQFDDVLGGADGLILAISSPDEMAVLDANALWQRLPAVKAGATIAANGNINYGSLYSARYVAGLADRLYDKIG